jgi:hypothetical protein
VEKWSDEDVGSRIWEWGILNKANTGLGNKYPVHQAPNLHHSTTPKLHHSLIQYKNRGCYVCVFLCESVANNPWLGLRGIKK